MEDQEPLYWERSHYHGWDGIAARHDADKYFIHDWSEINQGYTVRKNNDCFAFMHTVEEAKQTCQGEITSPGMPSRNARQQDLYVAAQALKRFVTTNAKNAKKTRQGLAIPIALEENTQTKEPVAADVVAGSEELVIEELDEESLCHPFDRVQSKGATTMATLVKSAPVSAKPVAKPAAKPTVATTATAKAAQGSVKPSIPAKATPVATKPAAPVAVAKPVAKAPAKPAPKVVEATIEEVTPEAEGEVVEGEGEAAAPKPKKPRIGMSDEEVAAAVLGELLPRDTVGSPDQESLTMTDDTGKPKGRPMGMTTGLPILGAWCYIFQENEKNPDDQKFTDEQITVWMKEEFPGRETPAFDRPNGCRNDYNNGKFTKLQIPKLVSKRYNADGTVWVRPPSVPGFRKAAESTVAAEGEEAVEPEPAPVVPKPAPKPTAKPVAVAKPVSKPVARK